MKKRTKKQIHDIGIIAISIIMLMILMISVIVIDANSIIPMILAFISSLWLAAFLYANGDHDDC